MGGFTPASPTVRTADGRLLLVAGAPAAGQVLTATGPGAATWQDAAPAGGGGAPAAAAPLQRAGIYYPAGGGTLTSATLSTTLTLAVPIDLRAGTLDRLACYINSGGVAGSTAQLGLYSDDGTGAPQYLLVSGTIATDTGSGKEITVNQVVAGGRYWLALAGVSGGPAVRSISNAADTRVGLTTLASLPSYAYQAAGQMPPTWPALTPSVSAAPWLVVRFSA